MVRKLVLATISSMLLMPTLGLVAVGALTSRAAAPCTPGPRLSIANVPASLVATTASGHALTLNRQQLTHAATIITVGSRIEGVTRDGLQIALMAALTESTLRHLANPGAYPDSADFPNDGNGSDHDSLGLFQMRPQSGWGTVVELMNPNYQVAAFFGGPSGPNYPSPRGLLDIPRWQTLGKGEAAQAVEVSAFPDRYNNYAPVAEKILSTLTNTNAESGGGTSPTVTAESSRVVFPLPEGTWVLTSDYGARMHPITGKQSFHTGTDVAAPDGTPILAAADGTVTVAGSSGDYGGLIVIEHRIDGYTTATAYGHMWEDGIHVTAGQKVTAGQHIGDVGSSGNSTGPHLHFEVRQDGTNGATTNPAAWLNDHHADDLPAPTGGAADGCDVSAIGSAPDPYTGGDPDQLVDDPTTGGKITARMAYVMAQTKKAFPETSWSCYSSRPGTTSEHPLGRACDITFGNSIGHRPTPAQLDAGWQGTNWMKEHAQMLGVEYLIWQGTIWSLARDDQGWRPYNGGGMHDPASITGGHFDHLHATVRL